MTAAMFGKLRRRLGVSQAQLARLLAVAPNSVARIERAELNIRPSLARLMLLVVHLHEKGDPYAQQLADQASPPIASRPKKTLGAKEQQQAAWMKAGRALAGIVRQHPEAFRVTNGPDAEEDAPPARGDTPKAKRSTRSKER